MWLSHLEDSIPIEAQRNRISLYTIALEGWRRGLELSFRISKDDTSRERLYYSLSNEEKTHWFSESSGDRNSDQAQKICQDKNATNKYLIENNVPIPKSKKFTIKDSPEKIVNSVKDLGYPLVVKPTDGDSGRGVIVNIKDKQSLISAINHVRLDLKYENLIVQQHIEGHEVRFYVLDQRVIAAAHRRPANVVGDGEKTIFELIEHTNEQRKNTPHLNFRPIRLDQEVRRSIESQNYTFDTVLDKGERLFLREISNVSTGGESIDVTEKVTKQQKRIAIEAANSIPGLAHCGVDMIVTGDTGVILEINTRPGIGSHLFPSEGKATDIPKEVIDFYFPETKGYDTSKSNVFIDLQTVFDTLYNGYLTELTLNKHPSNNLHTKKVIIDGSLDVMTYFNELKKYLSENNYYGFFKNESKERIAIVIGHEKEHKIKEFQEYLYGRRNNLRIKNIKTTKWLKPIKMSLELIDGYDQLSLIELEAKQHQLSRQFRTLERETNRLAHRINLTETSSSWKITKPIRKLKDIMNK